MTVRRRPIAAGAARSTERRQYLCARIRGGSACGRCTGRARGCDLKAVPGIGAEIVLTVDGELGRTRLFRSHEQAELVGAIADTRTMFEGKGWA